MIVPFKDIYIWEATLFSGRRIYSPITEDQLKDGECKFADLDCSIIQSFLLKPLDSKYAPIRIQTNGAPFKYYRVITDSVFYVIEAQDKIYVVKYPDIEYKIFRNIEEAQGYFCGQGVDI